MSARDQIINYAKQLRQQNPQKYGIQGAKKGTQGWVPNGWRQAVIDSAAQYRQSSGKPPAKKYPKRVLDPQQKAYRKVYREQLRGLKMAYQAVLPGIKVAVKKTKSGVPKPVVSPLYHTGASGSFNFSGPSGPVMPPGQKRTRTESGMDQ